MKVVGSAVWPKLRVLQVHGANTGVGKTIWSTILCKAFQKRIPRVHYLKPVSTGPLSEADDSHIQRYAPEVKSRTLFQYHEPVSPHIAARLASKFLSDAELQAAVHEELASYEFNTDGVAIVEAAGAVLSPAPSGSTQADAYRPLRIPAVLIGDSRLGGIGSTISAFESLHMRGYDVRAIALFKEDRFENSRYLKDYFAQRGFDTFAIPPPPEQVSSSAKDIENMRSYYQETVSLPSVSDLTKLLDTSHSRRLASLKSMPGRAVDAIWHPFMQHTERKAEHLTVIDSAYGDFFQTYSQQAEALQQSKDSLLTPAFDGSASWWTQGLGHGNPSLALTAAHAAGRYGHVMFANAVHEPALNLAETLIQESTNPKLNKVFFTDNGSTGMEVAVKMALRASSLRNGWTSEDEIHILGLTGSYHGDTIGTMDCSQPSIYNKKVEWYQGRGYWLDFPQVQMRQGKWVVEAPESMQEHLGTRLDFDSLAAVFDLDVRVEDAHRYRTYLRARHGQLRQAGYKFGALVMEPVILGAGGMMLVDPLFQRCLVDVVREFSSTATDQLDWQGMPVIFDEVFTGLYRLGRFSAASFLGTQPDIVVNAKLLTGGLLPLCTTTASKAIFDAFLSDDKSDALLHGHSYTAHAVGCAVANHSIRDMLVLDHAGGWESFRADWNCESRDSLWSMWSQDFLKALSCRPNVDYAFALGSVLAVSLKDSAGAGYASTAAISVRDELLNNKNSEAVTIHSRVLGNVLYLMSALTTQASVLKAVEQRLLQVLR